MNVKKEEICRHLLYVGVSARAICPIEQRLRMHDWSPLGCWVRWFLCYRPILKPTDWLIHSCKPTVILIYVRISSSSVRKIVSRMAAGTTSHLFSTLNLGGETPVSWLVHGSVERLEGYLLETTFEGTLIHFLWF